MMTVVVLAAWASMSVWLLAFVRWRQGMAVLPFEIRRRVPWRGSDVVVVLALFLGLRFLAMSMTPLLLTAEQMQPPQVQDPEEAALHPVMLLLKQQGAVALVVAVLAAVVVAPVVEEFVFRVVFQGWLEAAEQRWRRRVRWFRSFIPRGLVAILIPSTIFAALHVRREQPAVSSAVLIYALVSQGFASVLATAIAVARLRLRRAATWEDLGVVPGKLVPDIGLGLLAAVAVCPMMYLIMSKVKDLLPPDVAPDPIPLFFFALALGILYLRTHRISAPITLHVALNGTSLALAWLALS